MIDFTNLPRWIFASCSEDVKSKADNAITFVEGLDRPSENDKDFAEFRLDGPRFTELSKGYWQIWIAINVLVQSTMDDEDFHRKYVTIGKIVEAMKGSISIFKYGDGPDDDDSLVGCFSMIQDKNNQLRVNHMGQIDKTLRLEQATVEAHYHMYLTEDT